MQITANTQALAQEMRALAKVSLTKANLPILTHVLLRADDTLRIYSSDMEVSLDVGCDAQIQERGTMTLPAKPFLDMLERFPDADVTVNSNGQITSGSFRSRLGSLPTADFPAVPSMNGAEPTTLSAQVLYRLVERTVYAISEKEQKFVLKGAFLSLTGEVAAMVATDGKRLSIITAARKAGPEMAVIVPLKTLEAILDQTPIGDVQISKTDRHLFFNFGKRLIVSRVIDGEFPKYQRIIPKANNAVASVDRAGLTSAVRRVGLVAETLSMRFTPDAIELSSRSMEIGDADEVVPVRYEGPEIKVNLNWKYLLDFLEHAVEPIVTIAAKDGQSPLLLSDGGGDFINVVMVIRS